MKINKLIVSSLAVVLASGMVLPVFAEEGKKAKAKEAAAAPAAAAKTPDSFKVIFRTTKGQIGFDCDRSWSPKGADRFFELVKGGFFSDIAFFRVIEGFVAQFGIHGDPKVSAKWRDQKITDDSFKESNKAGTLVFATGGKDTRTTQFFINLVDNPRLDQMGFTPICKTDAKGMEIVKKIYSGYGEGAPGGNGPAQDLIQMEGNAYLKKNFAKLDYIKSASIKK